MNIPMHLKYTRTHEWVKLRSDGTATVGITDVAQDLLGDIVYINLPAVGDEFGAGEVVADVESVKSAADIYTPVTGTVSAVNESVMDAPESVNHDAYASWLVQFSDVAADTVELLNAEEYTAFVHQENQ